MRPTTPLRLPEIVAHADWSTNPPGRQIAIARRVGARYTAAAPHAVGAIGALFETLQAEAGPGGTILLGVDFPIGLPAAYARAAGITAFRAVLPQLGHGKWREFYKPAEQPEQIRLTRPFFPARNGAVGAFTRGQLAAGLGVGHFDDLHRACDRGHPDRAAAAALFWTLGGNQVGKAAISGWRDLISPALRGAPGRGSEPLRLWPFDGTLATLLDKPSAIIAETYPGEIYGHLGLGIGARARSKRRQADRQADAKILAAQAAALDIDLADGFAAILADGFGADARGEDRFDAAVGLIGMINILRGNRAPGDPRDRERRTVEGWILGQAETPSQPSPTKGGGL